MLPTPRDIRIRAAALAWCEQLRARWGDHVPAAEARRFPFEDGSIFLYGQQGIFKPRELGDGPLSIRTSLSGPYQDEVRDGGESIRYDYSPRPAENEGLKRLAAEMTPVVYLVQVKPKPAPEYMIVAPAFVLDWNDAARTFEVSYQPAAVAGGAEELRETSVLEKRYGLQVLRARLHQAHFRKEVLSAYRNRCAVCELRVRPLLDGAHIVPDSLPGGDPVVQNGLSLCALHHRAFDRRILRVDEDYRIDVDPAAIHARDAEARRALLDHRGARLVLPPRRELWPDPERLRRVLGA
ncbi:MAG: HNH endonuclease [Planctomycetes bacterium]|nr:HNH endonuclease [Planctomycetota bacterium]MBL7008986.1 HNH endonuclease [Planctomycetota bacterium]